MSQKFCSIISWGISSIALLASWGSWLSPSLLLWCDPTSNVVCSFGHLNIQVGHQTIREFPEETDKDSESLKNNTYKEWFRSLGLFSWRREGWGVISSQSTTSSGRQQRERCWSLSRNQQQPQGNGRKLYQGKFRLHIRKRLYWEVDLSLEEALYRSGHSTKPVRVQGTSGWHS